MSKVQTTTQVICPSCKAKNRLPIAKLLDLKISPSCGKCETALLPLFDADLKNLENTAYIHPLDKEALGALKRVPGVQSLFKSLIKHSFELATRLHHEANFIHVSATQMPTLWGLYEKAYSRLGIHEKPELYVYQSPAPNAYTFGVEKSFIAISTGCLELMDNDEILCVLAHELGHVHCDHVLYKSASRIFGSMASALAQVTFGLGNLVIYPIQAALTRWDRASELSSDRASLLVVRDPQIVLRTLMKLAGGSTKFREDLNIDSFVEQAESFEKMQEEGPLGRYMSVFNTMFQTHPYPVFRAKEIINWVAYGNYLNILGGQYEQALAKRVQNCSHCGKKIKNDSWICPHCGENCEPESEHTETDPLGKTLQDVKQWYKRNFTMPD